MYKMIIVFLLLNFQSAIAESVYFDNMYQGLNTGSSTLDDVIVQLGKPISKKVFSNNVRYFFGGVDISIQDATGKINTIQVYDKSYIDLNGISVGYPKSVVQQLIGKSIPDNTYTDRQRGIVYWFENQKVSKIVLVSVLNLN